MLVGHGPWEDWISGAPVIECAVVPGEFAEDVVVASCLGFSHPHYASIVVALFNGGWVGGGVECSTKYSSASPWSQTRPSSCPEPITKATPGTPHSVPRNCLAPRQT